MDFPVEVQVTVLLYLCPLKDILWSEAYNDEDPKAYWKLNRAMYGLRQAPKKLGESWTNREVNQDNARELHVMYPTSMSRRLDQTFRTVQDRSSKCLWAPDGNTE